jgi:hypothetical protein
MFVVSQGIREEIGMQTISVMNRRIEEFVDPRQKFTETVKIGNGGRVVVDVVHTRVEGV